MALEESTNDFRRRVDTFVFLGPPELLEPRLYQPWSERRAPVPISRLRDVLNRNKDKMHTYEFAVLKAFPKVWATGMTTILKNLSRDRGVSAGLTEVVRQMRWSLSDQIRAEKALEEHKRTLKEEEIRRTWLCYRAVGLTITRTYRNNRRGETWRSVCETVKDFAGYRSHISKQYGLVLERNETYTLENRRKDLDRFYVKIANVYASGSDKMVGKCQAAAAPRFYKRTLAYAQAIARRWWLRTWHPDSCTGRERLMRDMDADDYHAELKSVPAHSARWHEIWAAGGDVCLAP